MHPPAQQEQRCSDPAEACLRETAWIEERLNVRELVGEKDQGGVGSRVRDVPAACGYD